MFLSGWVRIAGAVAAAATVVAGLVVLFAWPGTAPARAIAAATITPPPTRPAHHPGVTGCAKELSHHRGGHLLVVVGASFTAGVGPGTPDRSWAMVLARSLGWNAVVYGVPGAGYFRTGAHRQGPVIAELNRIDLGALDPDLIIVQAGHDDIGVNPQVESQRAEQTIALIHAEAPRSRIALVTVFQGRAKLARALPTDRAIVTGARAADPGVIVMDPLAGQWDYQRSADGLHPTVAGSDWLAGKVAGLLRGYGVRAAHAGTGSRPILCDYNSAGKHSRIRVPPPATASARTDPPWLSAT